MASGIRDLSITFGSRIVQTIIGIGIASYLAWNLKADGRGSYAVAVVFMSLLSLIFMVGLDNASVYFVASKKWSLSKGVVNTLVLGSFSSLLAIGVGLIIIKLPLPFLSKASPLSFHIALLGIPILTFSVAFSRMLTSVHEFTWLAVISSIQTLFHLLFAFLFIGVFTWGVEGALLALIASALLSIVLALVVFYWKYDLSWERPTLENLIDMFHYGIRYYAGKISNQVNFRMGTIILALFATTEEIGLFAVAISLTSRIDIIPSTVMTVLMPRVAGDSTKRGDVSAMCARLSAVICGLLLLILAIFTKPIVAILFSTDFYSAVPLIRILAIGFLVRCTCKIFVPYFLGINRPGISSISVIPGVLVNLLVLWILLPVIGLPAAALGTTISYFVSSTILVIAFSKLSKLRFHEIWRYRRSDFEVCYNASSWVKSKLPFRS